MTWVLVKYENHFLRRQRPGVVLTHDSSLDSALGAFTRYMGARGFTEHTRKAFYRDMLLLREYLEPAKSIGDISTGT